MQDSRDADELRKIFTALDDNSSGTISLDELQHLIAHPKFRTYLRVRGIRIEDAELFHSMLISVAGDINEEVDISVVVAACLRMKGFASSMDLHALSFEARLMHRRHRELLVECTSRLQRIEAIMASEVAGHVAAGDQTRSDFAGKADADRCSDLGVTEGSNGYTPTSKVRIAM